MRSTSKARVLVQEREGYPSNGRVAWAAWGGDAGKSWSDARAKRIKSAREGRQLISNNGEELLGPMEQEQERAAPDALKTGDFVSWNSSGGRAEGRIDRVERDGTIDVPDSSFTITGTEDDPAALITLYRDKEATDRKVGHKFSTLTKIAPIRAEEPEEKRSVVGERMQHTEATEIRTIDDRTFEFPFSSEYPVSRYFGTEVLSHEGKSA